MRSLPTRKAYSMPFSQRSAPRPSPASLRSAPSPARCGRGASDKDQKPSSFA
jgi:hypothetical protein